MDRVWVLMIFSFSSKRDELVDDSKSHPKCMNPNEAKAKERIENCMIQSDGLVLVYNVLDDTTFAAACDIRNKFVQLRTNLLRSDEEKKKPTPSILSKLLMSCCNKKEEIDVRIPPIFLVGTHAVSADLNFVWRFANDKLSCANDKLYNRM